MNADVRNSGVVGWAFAVCLVGSLMTAGCGGGGGRPTPTLGRVTGTVTYNAEPVSEGVVSLGGDSGIFSAALGEGGTYSLQSEYGNAIPVGEYQVRVLPPQPEGFDPAADPDAPPPEPPDAPNIPEKYRDFPTSGLTVQVTEGENTLDIEMTD